MPKPITSIRALPALAVLAALAVASSGCGTTTADVQRGRTLFIQKCGVCHEMAQAGTTAKIGPNLDDAFAAARAAGQTDSTIEGIVIPQVESPRPSTDSPNNSMPADIVSGQDLDDVAAYVGMWAGVPGAEPPKVPGGPGAQVFANNGCGGCHTLAAAGSGGVTGPNLNEYLAPDDNAAGVEEMIVDPNAEIAEGFPANVMPQDYGERLTGEELKDLVEFLIENTPAGGNKPEGPGGEENDVGGPRN
ncbi:MAG TPA: cytochrome c [Solirubrobacterales bacterium]|nr:cytochrome c [Solirubrobacterales bacterium]